jgi:Tfp pilus assembly protein PilF
VITSPTTARRLLIPRWRSFATTTEAGELGARKSVKLLTASSPNLAELQKRRDSWHKSPSEVTAAELVESALVHGRDEIASGAAQFLASVQADVTPLVRRQSQQLLARLANQPQMKPLEQSAIRDRLRQSPDNAVLWVELALRQIISGAPESAVRSMRTALQLAPDNRFVLRSAARLFSHLHEPDIGYHFLRKSPATEYDPWLMSAEIALASRIEKRAAFLRKGLSVLEGAEGNPRLELSELAGAAATTYLDGTLPKRHAKRLFVQSLSAPTDSAVAQAEWASQATGERFLDASMMPEYTRAKEAQALHAFNIGNYEVSLTAALDWIAEEEFSGRAHLAAASAANTMDNYTKAIEICNKGVWLDPRSPHLRNNLIFALASSDQLTKAEHEIAQLRAISIDQVSALVLVANQGLVAMRKLQFTEGEALYRKSMIGFRRLGNEYLSVSALAYFAREADRANHPRAAEIVKELRAARPQRKHSVAERLLKQLSAGLAD